MSLIKCGVTIAKLWRRLWHLFGGSFLPVLALFITREALLITVAAITGIVVGWEISRFSSARINAWMVTHLSLILKPQEKLRPIGTTYLLVSSLITFSIFEKYIAITALLFLAIGDFMAAVIGEKCGRHKIFRKSLEGSLACLLSCLLIAVVMTRITPSILLPVAAIGAISATIIELLPIPIDDNLSMPIVSAGIMTLTVFYFA